VPYHVQHHDSWFIFSEKAGKSLQILTVAVFVLLVYNKLGTEFFEGPSHNA
jgi:hypothetical protein